MNGDRATIRDEAEDHIEAVKGAMKSVKCDGISSVGSALIYDIRCNKGLREDIQALPDLLAHKLNGKKVFQFGPFKFEGFSVHDIARLLVVILVLWMFLEQQGIPVNRIFGNHKPRTEHRELVNDAN